MSVAARPTLILGWGNPGRLDDGLGPAVAERVERSGLPDVVVDTGYQLLVEDAHELARFDRVLFVDADRSGTAPFRIERIEPTETGMGFSSHSVTPGALLSLARDLFDARPEAWLIGVRGYDFDEFGEGLSPRARRNLELAADFIGQALAANSLDAMPRSAAASNPRENDA